MRYAPLLFIGQKTYNILCQIIVCLGLEASSSRVEMISLRDLIISVQQFGHNSASKVMIPEKVECETLMFLEQFHCAKHFAVEFTCLSPMIPLGFILCGIMASTLETGNLRLRKCAKTFSHKMILYKHQAPGFLPPCGHQSGAWISPHLITSVPGRSFMHSSF